MSPDFSSGAGLSTLELLDARKRTGSKPGQRKDGRRLALVVEGGGMRGVIAAGMLSALEELGYRDCFDVVYGSSAGAFGGAYFIAGQARYGSSIYQEINNTQFINLWRLALARPVVALEFLLDEVCGARKPLSNWRRPSVGSTPPWPLRFGLAKRAGAAHPAVLNGVRTGG